MSAFTVELDTEQEEKLKSLAATENRPAEAVLSALVDEGLDAHLRLREKLDKLSEVYRARLAREGKLDRTREEVLNELRESREQIARELYP